MPTEDVEIGDERLSLAVCGGRVDGLRPHGEDAGVNQLDVVAYAGHGLGQIRNQFRVERNDLVAQPVDLGVARLRCLR